MRLLTFTAIAFLILINYSLGAERVAYFVISESKNLQNVAQEIEFFLKRYIETRMYIPAEVSNRELAVFEDEINRQNQEAANLLAEGKRLYEEFQVDQSFFLFQRIVINLEKGGAVFDKSTDYQNALMYLGNIYQLKGEKTLAAEIFIRLLMHNSKYTPDPNYFPPEVIDAFEKARTEFKNLKKGSLQIIPKPEDAQVFLDGSFLGSGVFKIDDIKVGEHLIGITKRGYMPYIKKVSIQSGVMEYVNAELIEFKEVSERYKVISEISEKDISTKLLPILKAYSKDSAANIVVIVFVSGSPNNISLSGYSYYKDSLVVYDSVSINLVMGESRKKVIKTKTDELFKTLMPDNIGALKPIEKISHKKFYNSWWFYGVAAVTLISGSLLGYLLLSAEKEEEDNKGVLVISF